MTNIGELPDDWDEQLKHASPKARSLMERFPPNVLYEYNGAFIGLICGMNTNDDMIMLVPKEMNLILNSFYISPTKPEDITEYDTPEAIDTDAFLAIIKTEREERKLYEDQKRDMSDVLKSLLELLKNIDVPLSSDKIKKKVH